MLPDGFETARLVLRPMARDDATAIFLAMRGIRKCDPFLDLPTAPIHFRHRGLHREAGPTDESRTFVLIERFDSRVIGAFELRSPEPPPARLRLCAGSVHSGGVV